MVLFEGIIASQTKLPLLCPGYALVLALIYKNPTGIENQPGFVGLVNLA